MKYNFDWNIVSEGAPYITVSKLGIAFNAASIKQLGSPDYIMIGFDSEHLVIGVAAVPERDECDKNVYQIKDRIRYNWVRIGCKEFIRYLEKLSGISFEKAVRYMAEYDPENYMLTIKINEGGEDDDCDDCT